jgi:hypothetical protein
MRHLGLRTERRLSRVLPEHLVRASRTNDEHQKRAPLRRARFCGFTGTQLDRQRAFRCALVDIYPARSRQTASKPYQQRGRSFGPVILFPNVAFDTHADAAATLKRRKPGHVLTPGEN